jgi:hypothetical protein
MKKGDELSSTFAVFERGCKEGAFLVK